MRRSSAALGLLIPAALAISGCARSKPDILVVAVDSFRADRLGRQAGATSLTPNLDAIAAGGTVFGEARTPSPALPAALLALLEPVPSDTARTLASVLRDRGYMTVAVVSSLDAARPAGVARGFDVFDDSLGGSYKVVDPSFQEMQDLLVRRERRAGKAVDAALRVAARAPKGPLFVLVHLVDPEQPYDPPLPYASEHASMPYDGEIAYLDAEAARLVAEFSVLRGKKPVVVFAGLCGEGLGEHGETTHGFFVYDSTIRVPLFFTGPGIPAGRAVREPVSLRDVPVTLAGLAGARLPAAVGRDLRPAFGGGHLPDAPLVATAYVGKERHGWSAVAAVVGGGWKYVRAPVPELYRLADDPGEARNLADSLPDEARRLSSLLDSLGGPSVSALSLGAAVEPLPDPKAAIADWNRVQQARLHLRHGRLFEQAGASDRALEEFDEAAAAAPELAEVHTHRGSALRHLGRMDDARRAFRQAIERDARFAPGWAGLGLVEEDTGHLDEARSAFRRALEESGGNGEVILSVLSFALRRKDLPWAVEAAERLVAVRPNDPTSLGDLATLYLEAGRVEESLATSRRAVLSAPKDPRVHYNLGRALVAASKNDEAAAAFERFLELAPDAPNAAAVRRGIEELRRREAGT